MFKGWVWSFSDLRNTEGAPYEVDANLNPFYLRGDFGGDKKSDYAVHVRAIRNSKRGILVCWGATRKPSVLGAGMQIPSKTRGGILSCNYLLTNRKVVTR